MQSSYVTKSTNKSGKPKNRDLESAIDFLGRSAVAEAAGSSNPQLIDGWRRRGEVPAKHCEPIIDAYRKKLKAISANVPTMHGLNPSAFTKKRQQPVKE